MLKITSKYYLSRNYNCLVVSISGIKKKIYLSLLSLIQTTSYHLLKLCPTDENRQMYNFLSFSYFRHKIFNSYQQ